MSGRPLALLGPLVLSMDDRVGDGRRDVLLLDGRIEAVQPPGSELPDDAERVDCSGRILLPGLVNAHLHPELILLKGMMEGLDLHEWVGSSLLNRALELLDSPDGRPLQRAATRAALAECLLGGQTCVVTYGVTDGMERICADTLAELGLRGRVTVRDASFAPITDGLGVPHMYRIHAEETLTEEELGRAAAAHERGDWLVMHAAETRHRRRMARERFGMATIHLLHERGLLSPRVLLSHAVFLDDREREHIVRAGAPVLASPSAEMKLADGVAPVTRLHEAGAVVALGTDAAVCNNGSDMLLEARQLGLLQRLHFGVDALPAPTLLRMATIAGAAAIGESDRFGRVAPGMAADLTLLDAGSMRLQPLVEDGATAGNGATNVAANVVFAATAQDVTDVVIGGEWKVREREPVAFDIDAVVRDLTSAGWELLERVR